MKIDIEVNPLSVVFQVIKIAICIVLSNIFNPVPSGSVYPHLPALRYAAMKQAYNHGFFITF